jgi:lauroyl/myristoyl acyltransferase
MNIDLQQVMNSSLSLRLVSSLAQRLPPRLGYSIAFEVAGQIARRRDSKLVQAVRANQWVVSAGALEGEVLDQVVLETLRNSAHSLFDLYHYVHDFEATRRLIAFDASFASIARRQEFADRGLMIAGLHMSSFDLVLQWLARDGLRPLVLTIPDPRGGRQLEYEFRQGIGMNLLPASVPAFRQALKHLRRGGMVLTGIDRPIEKPDVMPRFFGRPASLPIHHIFLAIKARVPIIITAVYRQEDGKYHVFASHFIEMEDCPNFEDALLRNAEKVLAVAETFIQRAPQQWSVPLPLWPQMMDSVPK